MKYRIPHMALIFAAYILLTAKTCAPEPGKPAESDENGNSTIGRIMEELNTEDLTIERQDVLTEKAIQKLTDFSDYLSLTADKKMDLTFRQQAKNSAASLFYTSKSAVQISVPSKYGISKTHTLQSLYAFIDNSIYSSMSFRITNIEIQNPLTRENDTLYQGRLTCQIKVQGISTADTTEIAACPMQVDYRVVKSMKKFGNKKTRQVWQVFLGDILTSK